MSSDSTEPSGTSGRTEAAETRSRLEALEGQLPRDNTLIEDRLSGIRGHVTAYEEAESEDDQHDVLDSLETEIDRLRESVESEVDEGTERAHELVDRLEERVSELR